MSYHCSLSAIKETGKASNRGASAWLLARLKQIEDENFISHPFESLDVMIRELNLHPQKFAQWRMVKCQLGMINGLPRSRGIMVAQSGVECLIYFGGKDYYIGHKDYWVREYCEGSALPPSEKREKKPRKKTFLQSLVGEMNL